MCGICGIVDFGGGDAGLADEAARMRDTLRHRGPDGAGLWVDAGARAALGHTRLAIIDLSDGGAQPMTSADGRWTVTYNGEIYNHRELRDALARDGVAARSSSDTEVLVEAIAAWGIDAALRRAAGMFAFAAWDAHAGVLHLARDRLGKKPLYVAARGSRVAFASELRALLRWRALAPAVDDEAAAQVLAYGYVRGERSILRDVFRLAPASRLAIAAPGDARPGAAVAYWDPRALLEPPAQPLHGAHAQQRMEAVLGTAVAQRVLADVPVGALLSGGIDSSLVVALMREHATGPVHTFSIGFEERDYDEAGHAAAVARHLGTEHTALYVSARQALDAVREMGGIFDEPFADSSQVPTLLVARMAREHVKVALSGDGGDEVFGGYNRHVHAARLGALVAHVPLALRRLGAGALHRVPAPVLGALGGALGGRGAVIQGAADRAHRLAWLALAADEHDLYERTLRLPREGLGLRAPRAVAAGPVAATPAERFMYRDTVGYLPDDILVKVDRASMSCGLEVRSPLLDHRVLELAWQLHRGERAHGGQGKRLLRRMLERRVPRALFDRPKSGFAAPLHAWLRGPLREWAGALLEPAALREDGFIDPARAARAWRIHQDGRRNLQHVLWPALMFRAWRARWGL